MGMLKSTNASMVPPWGSGATDREYVSAAARCEKYPDPNDKEWRSLVCMTLMNMDINNLLRFEAV
jgi:hypothetical protein